MPRATVLLADDHAIVTEGIATLLREEFSLVGAVADGPRLLEAARKLQPDVIVTDIAMPGMSGLEALRQLRVDGIAAKVIFLTMHVDAELAAEAFRAGASGFVVKHSAGSELITAIHEALNGRVYLTPRLTGDVLTAATGRAKSGRRLTPRQREVLRLIADGRTMKEIAAALGVSARTVETHKYEMMQALGVGTTAELIRHAIEQGLAGPPRLP